MFIIFQFATFVIHAEVPKALPISQILPLYAVYVMVQQEALN